MTHTHHRIRTSVALALALAAAAAPAASARPAIDPPTSPPGPPATHSGPAAPTTVRIVRVTDPSGFSWPDAAIGGAGALALTTIAVGGTLATNSRKERRTNQRRQTLTS